MNKLNVYSFAEYHSIRFLAHSVKDGNNISIDRAARYMAHLVSCIADERCVIIPVPGRTGIALYTKVLAERISELTGVYVLDCLQCSPHMTQYLRKLRYGIDGMKPFKVSVTQDIPSDVVPILVDNVLDTGTTIVSAMQALNRTLYAVVLGNTHNFRLFNYPINLYEQSLTLQ